MRAPSKLSKEAKKLWLSIKEEYQIDDKAGLLLLTTAFEAFDRLRQCQQAIEDEGATYLDRFNKPKINPLLSVERDARAQMLAALKALNLDIEPLRDGPGKPPKGY